MADEAGHPLGDLGRRPRVAALLSLYRQEVLRWNSQINLFSRARPASHWSELLRQSLEALVALPGAVGRWDGAAAAAIGGGSSASDDYKTLHYIDIGSGSGLPGLAWHIALTAAGDAPDEGDPRAMGEPPGHIRTDGGLDPKTTLVERRSKRAWFLDRCIRRLGLTSVETIQATWGDSQDIVKPEASRTFWLLSLRALRLTDPQVLAGWRLAAGRESIAPGDTLLIARLRGPGPDWEAELPRLRQELLLPGEEGSAAVPLGAEGASGLLLLSHYRGV